MFESDSSDEEDQPQNAARRPRMFKPRINFQFEDRPDNHQSRFRLTEEDVETVCTAIGHRLQHPTRSNAALEPSQQVRVALRFLATGANYSTIADAHGVTKPTVSRAVHRVVGAVNELLLPELVKWPEDANMNRVSAGEFRDIAGLPCVIGCIDGTHVQIRKPHVNPGQFVNRHGNTSVNVMLVCDPGHRFLFVSAKWPGAVNDARVFRRSTLQELLEAGWRPHPNGYLLGDSGYPNRDYLLTPLPVTNTPQEASYNRAHKRTRVRIECAIGILKQRFRCLLSILPLEPVFACHVIRCCVALHNLLKPEMNVAVEDLPVDEDEGDNDGNEYNGVGVRRQQIIQLF